MANIRSSAKDARRSAAQAIRNRSIRSAVKTWITKARKATQDGGGEASSEQVAAAISSLDRAVAKGVLHRNNAARRKGRLMKRLGASDAPPAAAGAPGAEKSGLKGAGKGSAGKSSGKASGKSPSKSSSKSTRAVRPGR